MMDAKDSSDIAKRVDKLERTMSEYINALAIVKRAITVVNSHITSMESEMSSLKSQVASVRSRNS